MATPHGVAGAAVVAEGAHVYAFGVREPGDHAVWVMRWHREDFVAGRLEEPEYFGGDAWAAVSPVAVFGAGATEMSVGRHAALDAWTQVQSHGFGVGAIALRFADELGGPWTEPREAFRPPEAAREGVFCYAGKAHPQLAGADVVATYACNLTDAAKLFADETIYYPRFVSVELSR